MIDVQNQIDNRNIKIRETGVTNVHLPFVILNAGKVQHISATIKFTVSLSENLRGTHMSRLMEILMSWTQSSIKISDLEKILTEAIEKLTTTFASISITFKFFIRKVSPVSKKISFSAIDCEFIGKLQIGQKLKFTLGLNVPFTSLCPCSKQSSDFGAHNQRSFCKVYLTFKDSDKLDDIDIENICNSIEKNGSAKTFSILKRQDEKFITELAYKNPKFVEDILRDTVITLRNMRNLSAFKIECENFESIHNHNAFASYEEILEDQN